MATFVQLLAAATKWVATSDVAHDIVNGPATGTGSTVTTESGPVPTYAKQSADFFASIPVRDNLLTLLGVPTYADLTAANAALPIGKPFFNTATLKIDITTA